MAKERPTHLIRPGDRPEKDGEGTVYNVEDDLIMRMSDEINDPEYVDGIVNEAANYPQATAGNARPYNPKADGYPEPGPDQGGCKNCGEPKASERDEYCTACYREFSRLTHVDEAKGPFAYGEGILSAMEEELETLDEGVGYPMSGVLNGAREICFEDGIQVSLDDGARAAFKEHWNGLTESARPAFEAFVRKSHGNFCRTLALLG